MSELVDITPGKTLVITATEGKVENSKAMFIKANITENEKPDILNSLLL